MQPGFVSVCHRIQSAFEASDCVDFERVIELLPKASNAATLHAVVGSPALVRLMDTRYS